MAHKLIRIYGRGHLHFLTFSCYRRVPFLHSVRARTIFVQILGEVRDRFGFSLVGYVVMPEHVHLLIGEPAKGTPSTVIQAGGTPFVDFFLLTADHHWMIPLQYVNAEGLV